MVKIIIVVPRRRSWEEDVWNNINIPAMDVRAASAPVRGQGLWLTIWNGWW